MLIIPNFIFFAVPLCWPQIHCCSVAKSCPTLCDPMDHSMPALTVSHHLPELPWVHVHCIGDAIQPSHPLSPSSPALNLYQYQGLFQWVSCSHQVAKLLTMYQKPYIQLSTHLDINWACETCQKPNSLFPSLTTKSPPPTVLHSSENVFSISPIFRSSPSSLFFSHICKPYYHCLSTLSPGILLSSLTKIVENLWSCLFSSFLNTRLVYLIQSCQWSWKDLPQSMSFCSGFSNGPTLLWVHSRYLS